MNFQKGTTEIGDGSIDFFAYAKKEALEYQAYPEVFLKLDEDEEVYSDEYEDLIEDFEKTLRPRVGEVVKARCDLLSAMGLQITPEYYILGRDTNVGYVSFENDAKIVDGIASVFPIFFFALAALVCSTTMQRMVSDERSEIGTMRAVGYSKFSIILKYIIYSGSASVIGAIGGFAAGTKIFPYIIWKVYDVMYGFAPITFTTEIPLFLISLLVSILCSVGVTIVTCFTEFTETTAELVRPKAPPSGKRIFLEYITPVWKRLSFLHKVSARNIFRFKKRMWMMIIGIAGCTALLITGF